MRRSVLALIAAMVPFCLSQPVLSQEGVIQLPTKEGVAEIVGPQFSPYAGRNFPTKVLWGDTHLHTAVSVDAGTMCPSFRATGDEVHLTRGRANTLRLALSGQLGASADGALKAALDLCVSCKGCKRECPTGVDMARMKIEFLAHYRARHGATLRERLVAYLPRYAPWAARVAGLANLGSRTLRTAFGFTPRRQLPAWRSDWFVDRVWPKRGSREVVLLIDTFNRYFEPENARGARPSGPRRR